MHFQQNVLNNDRLFHQKSVRLYLEVLCRLYDRLFSPRETQTQYVNLNNYSSVVDAIYQEHVFKNLSFLEIGLLLTVDNVFFHRKMQQDLLALAEKRILDIEKFDEKEHYASLMTVLIFIKKRSLKLGQNSKILLHLIKILPLEYVNRVMMVIKLTNYEYTEVQEMFSLLDKQFFQSLQIRNIPLLATMNVYIPSIRQADFYIAHV